METVTKIRLFQIQHASIKDQSLWWKLFPFPLRTISKNPAPPDTMNDNISNEVP